MRILDRINRTGTTVVMATHDHAIVDARRRRVVQVERGRIVRDQSRGAYEQRADGGPTPDPSPAPADEAESDAARELAEAEAELAELPIDEDYSDGDDSPAGDEGEDA